MYVPLPSLNSYLPSKLNQDLRNHVAALEPVFDPYREYQSWHGCVPDKVPNR